MESGHITLMLDTLDDIRHAEDGVEFWYAKELFPLLGYSNWKSFVEVIDRAKISCKNSGGNIEIHFRPTTKTGSDGIVEDTMLSRYACYFIALNGDPSKEEIAYAQAYFVTQTRRIEVLEKRMDELARLESREKLKISEKEFTAMAYARGVESKQIPIIRSDGDRALFGGKNTRELKEKMGVPIEKPLANFLPDVTLKAKDLAMAMTTQNAKKKGLMGVVEIDIEHVENNKNIREALTKTDIYPEDLPPSEDVEQIKKRHNQELKDLEDKQKKELEDAIPRLF